MNIDLTVQISDHAVERAQMRGIGLSASDKLRLAALYGKRMGKLPWDKRDSFVRILDRESLRTVAKKNPHLSTIEIESLNGMVVATVDTGSGERIVTTTLPKFTGGAREWYRRNERYYRKLVTKVKRRRSLGFINSYRSVLEQVTNEQEAISNLSDVRGSDSSGIDGLRAAA